MTSILPSYIKGAWWTPSEQPSGALMEDASTGETIGSLSTTGLDLEGALNYARTVGQESLGKLTFHQRALLLKEFAKVLLDRKEELYAISRQSGATDKDSWVDIEGGIGVLFTYSGKGRRELPNSQVFLDGQPESLSKDGSFLGQHIYTRLTGVAVQINAFNFPVWGSLEKFAPAFIAGMPTIVKPASPTAYLAEAFVRILDESGLLPAGTLQLISGSARDLMDHLKLGDHVAFTGSASTAKALKAHRVVQEDGVRFTAETDSLNASILGPDVTEDAPEFNLFVRGVVAEMTTKAGQKCTAIRRIIVPNTMKDAVAKAIAESIKTRVKVGDPRDADTTMGPLASVEQRREVLKSVGTLVAAGGEVVLGSAEEPSGAGAFLDPILLSFADARTPEVHSVEAFGPVSSMLGYDTVAEAVELAKLGSGSLAASVVSYDPATIREIVLGMAAYHGRVLVLNRDDAKTSTGHGSPLPNLVHGGPGRAGGGEELGGIRGVLHYMQRTAIQGPPNALTAITGVWHSGADADAHGVHPFRKSLATLRIGDQIVSDRRTVTLEDIEHFAEFTGDTFYAHMDEEAAAANPFFPGRVAHGYLLISWAAGLFVSPEPGPVLANYGLENLSFVTPVSPGDSIRVTLTAKEITPRENSEYGEVRWDAVIDNQKDEIVATYDVLTLVSKE